MRAIDTNVLVYAAVEGRDKHQRALGVLRELALSPTPWAIPWPCLYEFLRVVTHPRVFHPPVPLGEALRGLESLFDSPSLELLSETPRHREVMQAVMRQAAPSGNLIHDAHIVALCIEHGVTELVTGDRDFARFAGISIVDPFTG